MALGDEERFQKRRHLFKYLGGLKEFPANLKRQLGKQKRKELIATLTSVYREEAKLYTGIPEMIQTLIDEPNVIVGMVTRNITNEPLNTLRQLFGRHNIDIDQLDFLVHIPLSEEKTTYFKAARLEYGVNPALAYICGDEYKDYLAAIGSGMHPFMVSYGFEDIKRRKQALAAVRPEFARPDPLPVAHLAPEIGDGRFDAAGQLIRVPNPKPGGPQYAILDANGNMRCYVSPAPGVNLRSYVGRQVGVTGIRGYIPDERATHIMARHVSVVEEPAVR